MGVRHGRLAAAGLLLLAVIAGCSTQPRREPGARVTGGEAVRWLQQRDRFALEGRVAGAVNGDGFNAQLDWQQQGAQTRLTLRSPLGFGSATVESDGSTLRFQSSRGEKLDGADAVAALTARLGAEPPLRSLRYWLLGVADPSQPAVEQVAVPGVVKSFQQSGWQVTVAEQMDVATGAGVVAVPRRVTVERAPARLRIVVDRWTLE